MTALWREARLSIHHDGSGTPAATVGGHRMSGDGYFEGSRVRSVCRRLHQPRWRLEREDDPTTGPRRPDVLTGEVD